MSHDVADIVEVLIEETLTVVQQAPLAHDTTTSTDDTTETTVGQMNVMTTDTGMYREIVDTLFALFYQRVTVNLPCEVFHSTVHLLESLIDRYRTHGHRTVTYDPLTRLVDIVTSGEVHQGVAAPLTRPHGLVDLLLDRRGGGGIADIRIDLHGKVTTDNHRLTFGVVDVRGNDCPTTCYL